MLSRLNARRMEYVQIVAVMIILLGGFLSVKTFGPTGFASISEGESNITLTQTAKYNSSSVNATLSLQKQGSIVYNETKTEHSVSIEKGYYDMELVVIANDTKKIKVQNISLNNIAQNLLKFDSNVDVEEADRAFMIDVSKANFSSAEVSVSKAKGKDLFKCVEWNNITKSCDGRWQKIKDIVPGDEYNFTIIPEDPGFAEFSELINIIDKDNYVIEYNVTIFNNDSGMLELLILPADSNIEEIRVYGYNSSAANDLGMHEDNSSNISFSIDPTMIAFDNISVKRTAKSQKLFKCTSWNFTSQDCDNIDCSDEDEEAGICNQTAQWVQVLNLTEGQPYNFTIFAGDPGYYEGGDSVGESSTISETYVNKLTKTFTPENAGYYLILSSAEARTDTTSWSVKVRTTLDGATISEAKWEPKDADWYDDYQTYISSNVVYLDDSTHTAKIDWLLTYYDCAAYIRNARISVIDLSEYNFTEAETEQSLTSSYVDKEVLTFNVPTADDYLIIATGEYRSASTEKTVYAQLKIDGVTKNEARWESKDPDDYKTFAFHNVSYLNAGSHTIKIRGKGEYDYGKMRGLRITAIRMTDDFDFKSAESNPESSTDSESLQTKTTLTFTPQETADYLCIATAEIGGSSTDDSVIAQLEIDGTTYADMRFEPKETSGPRDYTSFATTQNVTLDASSHTAKIMYKSEDDDEDAYIRNARITCFKVTPTNVTVDQPPIIHWVNDTPDPVGAGENITITAKVTDDVGVDSVLVDIEGTNYSMTPESGGGGNVSESLEAEDNLSLADGFADTTNCVCSSPSNGECIRDSDSWSSGDFANATFSSTLPTGTYNITYYICPEDGGDDTWKVYSDNNFVDTYTTAGGESWYSRKITGVTLTNGQDLIFGCSRGTASSYCRMDYFLIEGETGGDIWSLAHNTTGESGTVYYTVYANDTINQLAVPKTGNYTIIGSPCNDTDIDGVCDEDDNCDYDFNPGQDDFDNNGVGDACEPGCVLIDFERDENGSVLLAGQWITSQLANVTVSALNGGSGPDKAIIFNSSYITGGDPDLGTPHQDFGGPGIGTGGGDGQPGENNVSLRNILIIAEDDVDTSPADGLVDDPDDEASGGVITAGFEGLVDLLYVKILDIDESSSADGVESFDMYNNSNGNISLATLGGNSYQKIVVNQSNSTMMKVHFDGSAGLDDIFYCPVGAIPDNLPPKVFDLGPSEGFNATEGGIIEIQANVTDDFGIDYVYANITLPDTSVITLVLLDPDGDNRYSSNFTNTVQEGIYNVRFFGNDTHENINSSQTTFFRILKKSNLTVDKSDYPDPVVAGELLNYSIVIKNGKRKVYNVTLVETYPVNVSFVSSSPAPSIANYTFYFGTLLKYENRTLNITVRVNGDVANGTIITNKVNVSYKHTKFGHNDDDEDDDDCDDDDDDDEDMEEDDDCTEDINYALDEENTTVFNDQVAPIVHLISPPDNSTDTDGNIVFEYNVTDLADIEFCELVINGSVVLTDFNVTKDITQNFTYTLLEGTYDWYVNCTDIYGNEGMSEIWEVEVDIPSGTPNVTLISPPDNFVTTNTTITFNFTVVDDDPILNCTLYIDNIAVANNDSVLNNSYAFFTIYNISLGSHDWSVSCTDPINNTGWSDTWMFTIQSNISQAICCGVSASTTPELVGQYEKVLISADVVSLTTALAATPSDVLDVNVTIYYIENGTETVIVEEEAMTFLSDGLWYYEFYTGNNSPGTYIAAITMLTNQTTPFVKEASDVFTIGERGGSGLSIVGVSPDLIKENQTARLAAEIKFNGIAIDLSLILNASLIIEKINGSTQVYTINDSLQVDDGIIFLDGAFNETGVYYLDWSVTYQDKTRIAREIVVVVDFAEIDLNLSINVSLGQDIINLIKENRQYLLELLVSMEYMQDFTEEDIFLITDSVNSMTEIVNYLESGQITPGEAEEQYSQIREKLVNQLGDKITGFAITTSEGSQKKSVSKLKTALKDWRIVMFIMLLLMFMTIVAVLVLIMRIMKAGIPGSGKAIGKRADIGSTAGKRRYDILLDRIRGGSKGDNAGSSGKRRYEILIDLVRNRRWKLLDEIKRKAQEQKRDKKKVLDQMRLGIK